MKNLYEVLEKSNKELTTEQFAVYIHNILENGKGILSVEEIESLIDGSVNLFKVLEGKEIKRCDELNAQPKMTIDTYDFLQEHKEIQLDAYTPKQLEEMAEIDKKFKQLGNYDINKTATDIYWISFSDVLGVKTDSDFVTNISDFNENIYLCYFHTFNRLKRANHIDKYKELGGIKYKWDGENFAPYQEPKANIDEAKKFVHDDLIEMWKKPEPNKALEYTVSEAKKAIDQYFKDSSINSTSLQPQIEKAVKQEIENYNKDMALSKTMSDIFISDIVKKKSSEFRKELRNQVIDQLDIYGKVLTGQKDLIGCDCDNIETIKERVTYLNEFKKQLYSENFIKMQEKEFVELYNKAFNDNSKDIFQISRRENINLDFC